jgi:hypothetical protein
MGFKKTMKGEKSSILIGKSREDASDKIVAFDFVGKNVKWWL